MTQSEEYEVHPLDRVHLVKWPRLLVHGESVTPEQANEIIIRTTSLWYVGTNDHEWKAEVEQIMGLPPEFRHGFYKKPVEERVELIREQNAKLKARERALGTVSLTYLDNHRIASNYIGGPHGWCDWNGTIGAATYNIGKWPTGPEVHSDLESITAAFPFLRMTVQLVNDYYDGDEYRYEDLAAVTWFVDQGTVTYDAKPRRKIMVPREDTHDDFLMRRFTDPHGERGVSSDRLRQAVFQVERAMNLRKDEDGDE